MARNTCICQYHENLQFLVENFVSSTMISDQETIKKNSVATMEGHLQTDIKRKLYPTV